jgi:hypothetical protein
LRELAGQADDDFPRIVPAHAPINVTDTARR